ncbi:conserved hypothetical protein [Xylanimonas cellulosilytica DSM 15894]|uniref:ATPase AAA-type core domain-containing protein n=1 Tax=Xylanimonas cellulosilytica (strain DSM 15894 / JCM 12276 / CECT 5975 / KCTC 9989 / LMG 20990 / NBRC 107835 / XIL07) TaxID=446471 RepID=D1BYL1_XYLCX|nr:ATP-binding protein [Xylanimonas cellulosilytica]ACZ31883.1 conserved hypothetical protein [Xylanimonas cellulosilytica DSM 15894]
MLLSFAVENFRAFHAAQEFTMRRVGRSEVEQGASWDPRVSTIAAVYGANASGKSTLTDAIAYLQTMVRDSYTSLSVSGGTNVQPFLLDEGSSGRPSSFEIEFRAGDGLDYQYGFTVDRRAVLAEWLWVYRTARRSLIFMRERGGEEIAFGPSFRGDRQQLGEVAVTRPNTLTLSVGAQLGNRLLVPVHTAITSAVTIHGGRHPQLDARDAWDVVDMIEERPDLRDRLVGLLRSADLGIHGVSVRDLPSDERLEAQLTKALDGMGWTSAQVERFVRRQRRQLTLTHGSPGGARPLPFAAESMGTQQLVALAPSLIRALIDGSTVVVDEIDTSLHPVMVRAIVEMFASPESNPNQAQLVFTTHDTSLLGRSLSAEAVVSRDQVWRTEKDPATGVSVLAAFSDYSPRKSENLERGYLLGRYGGVPVIDRFGPADAELG